MLVKELEIPKELFDLAVEEYDCDWKSNLVKIKRFTFGETNDISRKSTNIKMYQVGGVMKPDVNIDSTEIQVLTLLKGVAEAPWEVNNVSVVNNLPPHVANWVLRQIEEFNSVSVKKKGSTQDSSGE